MTKMTLALTLDDKNCKIRSEDLGQYLGGISFLNGPLVLLKF